MEALVNNHLIVKKSTVHGYGVFATKAIAKDQVIESCYCIITNNHDPAFVNFYFGYQETKKAIPSGYGIIYNHSSTPNASYYFDEAKNLMLVTAKKNIAAGEEIFISYGKAWLADRKNLVIKKTSALRKLTRYLKGTPLRALLVIGGLVLITHLEYVSIAAIPAQKILETLAKTIPRVTNA